MTELAGTLWGRGRRRARRLLPLPDLRVVRRMVRQGVPLQVPYL